VVGDRGSTEESLKKAIADLRAARTRCCPRHLVHAVTESHVGDGARPSRVGTRLLGPKDFSVNGWAAANPAGHDALFACLDQLTADLHIATGHPATTTRSATETYRKNLLHRQRGSPTPLAGEASA